MIYYSKKNCELLQQNVVVLDHMDEEDEEQGVLGHIVLSRGLYDRLIVMNDKYGGDPALVERKLSNHEQKEAVRFFMCHVPEPLGIIAPFLHLIKSSSPVPLDVVTLCGYLHVISLTVDFDRYLAVSEEIRKSVMFSQRQVEGYKDMWKDLEVKVKLAEIDEDTVTKDFIKGLAVEVTRGILQEVFSEIKELAGAVSVPVPAQPVPSVNAYQPTVYPTAGNEPQEQPEEEDMNDLLAAFLEEELAAAEKAEEEEKAKAEAEREKEKEPEPEKKKEESVIDSIIAMYGGK